MERRNTRPTTDGYPFLCVTWLRGYVTWIVVTGNSCRSRLKRGIHVNPTLTVRVLRHLEKESNHHLSLMKATEDESYCLITSSVGSG
jgi:hypothetical protein